MAQRYTKAVKKDNYTPGSAGVRSAMLWKNDHRFNRAGSPAVQIFRGNNDEQDEPLIIRPMNPLNHDDPQSTLDSGRAGDGFGEQRHWVRTAYSADFVGLNTEKSPVQHFLLADGNDPATFFAHPYFILRKAINNVAEKGKVIAGAENRYQPHWNAYLKGSAGKGAKLPSADQKGFVQAFIARGHLYDADAPGSNKNVYTDFIAETGRLFGASPGDPLPIVVLNSGLMQSLISGRYYGKSQFDALLDASDEEGFLYDPIGFFDPATRTVQGGLFIAIFKPQAPGTPPDACTWNGAIEDYQGYEANLLGSLTNRETADLTSEEVAAVFDHYRFFTKNPDDPTDVNHLFHFTEWEEAVAIIATAFKEDPRLLEFGWFEHPEFFTDEVRGILYNRTTSAGPGPAAGEPAEGVVDATPAGGMVRNPAPGRAAGPASGPPPQQPAAGGPPARRGAPSQGSAATRTAPLPPQQPAAAQVANVELPPEETLDPAADERVEGSLDPNQDMDSFFSQEMAQAAADNAAAATAAAAPAAPAAPVTQPAAPVAAQRPAPAGQPNDAAARAAAFQAQMAARAAAGANSANGAAAPSQPAAAAQAPPAPPAATTAAAAPARTPRRAAPAQTAPAPAAPATGPGSAPARRAPRRSPAPGQ